MDWSNQPEHLSVQGLEALRTRALALGAGCIVGADEERHASPLELLVATLPTLCELRALAVLIDIELLAVGDWEVRVDRECAAVLRLAHCALEAHGRDHGYTTYHWHHQALARAQVLLGGPAAEPPELGDLVEQTTHSVAAALRAVPTDRLGVPEPLTDTLGTLIALFACTSSRA
jgi:hypothetical protein